MSLCQTRSTLLGAVLALVAMLGLVALSGWHSAVVHDDDPVHVASVEHVHGSSQQADPDGPIHVLAHAMGQWIALAGPSATPMRFALVNRVWPIALYDLRAGIDPSELLRPPRG
ncbi:hypothetical protein [Sphingomonas sp.]|uniref:hypothetical protein n=1 Tax=Sphingomonas sp. TaxID=28214 RepID=UPI0031D7440F